ncbi:MAG: S8 family serine peptidase [Phycisphaeraceae bacterium]|nr:S8 family serine peptidase [Phycisphaeraceae bacterium]
MNTSRTGALILCAGFAASMIGNSAIAADPLEAYLDRIRLNQLLATANLTGAGMNIGQIEDGAPLDTHVSLVGKVNTQPGIPAAAAAAIDHSTGVAALLVGQRKVAGGNFQGVAPGATLWSSPLGPAGGSTDEATLLNAMKSAVDWQLTAPRTSVVNMSWGVFWNEPAALRNGVNRITDWAGTQGQLYVAAAGNQGQQAGDGGNMTGNLANPGNSYNALTVGNLDGPDWKQIRPASSVSEVGKRLSVDICAPGTNINSAGNASNDTYKNWTGTSFATPITAGVVALLQQHGGNKGFSTDTRVMRAVIMNSADKTVQNRAGDRWDKQFAAGAKFMSNETGTGGLDAMEAYNQYNAGQGHATLKKGTSTHEPLVKATGWDVDTVDGKGAANGNDYITAAELRKGTYLTSTLVWNRDVVATDADVTKWTYADLAGMNLSIGKGTVGNVVSLSNYGEKSGGGEDDASKGTTQHNVYKTDARSQYTISAYLRTTSPIANIKYGLAWRGYEMVTNRVEEFNGGFDGDRGAYRDNGWFQAVNTVTFGQCVREGWMGGGDDNWAMRMVSGLGINAGVAQEVVRPFSYFVITFDIAFEAADFLSRVDVFLGNLMMGSVFADGTNTKSFQFISDFSLDATQLAALTPGAFVDLSFKFVSVNANAAYIDNIAYVPSSSALALMGFACVISGGRRRR